MSINNILFFYEQINPFTFDKRLIREGVNKLINRELKSCGEISVIFCNDKYLLEVNKKFLNHDFYTDIITFDYVKDDVISGDLFISVERIKENAKQFDTLFVKELYRVVFHGVLHLVGYKDKTESEKRLMREKENYYLEMLEKG